ncbi:MAG: ATP-dependent helicase [Coriobacteriaceae bacterium]|nr:ATP-dependent helicase [Coriobacteriaceae bacterium]
MPITLNDLTKTTPVATFSPKFFDGKLTGAGKKIGLLNETRNPGNIQPNVNTSHENIHMRKRHYSNGQADVTQIPFYVLSYEAWDAIDKMPIPDSFDMTRIAEKSLPNGSNIEAFVTMHAHTAILEEVQPAYKGAPTKKILTVCYRVHLFVVHDKNDAYAALGHVSSAARSNANCAVLEFTCNPRRIFQDWAGMLKSHGFAIDQAAIDKFMNDASLYDLVAKASEEWQTTIHETLDFYFERVKDAIAAKRLGHDHAMNCVARTMHRIEDYNVPLDLYRDIYKSIKTHFPADDATILCKENLNLLLSDTLNNLNDNKSQLTCLPTPAQPVQVDSFFSREQRRALTTGEPLTLVQAGAGTGKSTVILARIQYMIDCGIKPEDITVLSFTNAAADHITEKNPHVHSMTIASMIHSIYSANFTHELSSVETIINSLDIYYPNDDFAYEFRNRLQGVLKNNRDSFTRMNNFIERNYDKVMDVLDTIGQTSLELEIIICYQQIENLTEPAEVQSRYLIIDEVQDNSIFEFVYTLKYVDKHKESLFLVGDCSQTLYEFRASNPKALNVLEGSGVFATYQLQTNYRSNQEILDFANVTLADIEANQYANIQLQANSLAQVTAQSFSDKVHLHYERLNRISEFNDALGPIFAKNLVKYIDEKLAAGEQIAFLSFTRFQVNAMGDILKGLYPNAAIANLVPEKVYNSTVFSEFIKRYWHDVKFIPTKSIMNVIAQEIQYRLQYLVYDATKSQKHVQRMLQEWIQENHATVSVWQRAHMNGTMSLDDLLVNVRNNMLDFEIKRNAIRQSLVSARNQQNKQNQDVSNANFLLSTIHSAKGLEFENTVVLYQAKNDMDEEKKRMYYVAFTRAMKSEFIVAYDTVVTPKIVADYEAILDRLSKSSAVAQTAGADGVDVIDLGTVDDALEDLAESAPVEVGDDEDAAGA